MTFSDGHTDSYAYNGLGMRLTKQDPTGTHSYLADGVAPFHENTSLRRP